MARTTGYEPGLVREQFAKCAGVFGCNAWTIFTQTPMWLSQGPPQINTTVLPTVEPVKDMLGGKGHDATSSWVNVNTFLSAWDMIGTSREFEEHEWTVKADPDAVFLPSRLRRRLSDFGGVGAIYFTNCQGVKHGLYGSLEVISKAGIRKYIEGLSHCTQRLPYSGWGEDLFLQMCLDRIGIHHADDFNLVSDGCCNKKLVKGKCKHDAPCTSGETAFHPFKTVDGYFNCLAEAKR